MWHLAMKRGLAACGVVMVLGLFGCSSDSTSSVSVSGDDLDFTQPLAGIAVSAGALPDGTLQVDTVLQGEATPTTWLFSETAETSDLSLSSSLQSLNKTSAYPFEYLTLKGTGFRSSDAAISVIFRVAGLEPIIIPAIAVTSSSVEVVVPPLIDATGENVSGHATLQVLQVGTWGYMITDTLDGLDIGALPASELVAGSVTDAYLSAALTQINAFEAAAPGDLPASFWSALANLKADLSQLQLLVQSVMADPTATPPLPGTGAGAAPILDADTLRLADRLIMAMLLRLGEQLGFTSTDTLPAGVVSYATATANCPSSTGGQWVDDFICQRQQYGLELATKGKRAVATGAKVEASFYLGLFGGIGSSLWGQIAPRAATAFELVWTGVSGHIAAWATASEPPSNGQTLADVGVAVLDKLAGSFGLLSAAYNAIAMGQEYDAIIQAQASVPAPVTGLFEGTAQGWTTESAGGCTWQHTLSLTVRVSNFGGSGTLIDPYRGDVETSGSNTISLIAGVDCDTGGVIPIATSGDVVGGSSGKVEISVTDFAGTAGFTLGFPSGTLSATSISGPFSFAADGYDAPITGTLVLLKQ